jgi:hypothetical protein
MWRVLSLREADRFRYKYADPLWFPSYQFGYVCAVEVMMGGHENCGSIRSRMSEVIYLFRPHDTARLFPLNVNETDAWLQERNADGAAFDGLRLPGFLVRMPRTMSYGYFR